MRVAFCSPAQLPRDGVGSYSRELCASLSGLCTLEHFPLDKEVHESSHFRRMAAAVNRCEVMHVEHTHAFFKLPLYPFRDAFRAFLQGVTIPRLVVFHEPLETVPVNRPADDGTIRGRAKSALLYCAVGLSRPAANALWLPRYNRGIYSVPERVVFHTQYRAAAAKRFAPEARIAVLPHPVYAPGKMSEAGRNSFTSPFPKGSVVLTVFGFIDRRKDYPGVLETLLKLPPRFKLLIAGGCHDDRERENPDSPYARIIGFVRANGLEGRVHITGFCSDGAIPAVMAATDVVIAPFTENHSSGSVNMGLAYSRPVVAYRTLLTDEMNRNGAGLILVDGKAELASLLSRGDADSGLYSGAVGRGKSYCAAYGFPAAAARFIRWYEEMLASR